MRLFAWAFALPEFRTDVMMVLKLFSVFNCLNEQNE
jgi:hypothetical protein